MRGVNTEREGQGTIMPTLFDDGSRNHIILYLPNIIIYMYLYSHMPYRHMHVCACVRTHTYIHI